MTREQSREEQQEASIPVQGRVNFKNLATAHRWWELQGVSIRTMSSLLSYTFDAFIDVLEANDSLKGCKFDSLSDANMYLRSNNLYQRSARERGRKKISSALRFEAMRGQGIDPRFSTPVQHKMVHKHTSVQPNEVTVETGKTFGDVDWDAVDKRIAEEDKKDVDKTVKEAKDFGMIEERDKNIITQENEDIDASGFPVVKE